MMKGRIPPPPPPPGSAKPQAGSPDSAKPQAAATVLPPPLPLPLGPLSVGRRRSVWLLGSVLAAAILAAVCGVGYYAASTRSSSELDDATEASLYASDPDRPITAEFHVPEVSAVAINPGMKKEPIRAELIRGKEAKNIDVQSGVKTSLPNLYTKRTKGDREQWLGNYGGSAISEKAVTDGLDWLVRHQAADGSWSNKNLGPGAETLCKRDKPCFGTGEAYEMAHTGLALLALQAGGHCYFDRQPHSDAVRKGLDWMVSHQRSDGGLVGSLSQGNNFHQNYMYEHGIAAFALADACAAAAALGEPRHERYFSAMEKAVEFIYRHQHNDGGWRYTPEPNATSDTSVTGWPVLALKSAKEAGVPLREEAVEKVRAYFRAREAGQEGRTGYDSPQSYNTHATTGVGMLARQFLLNEPDAPLIRAAADHLAKTAEATWKDRSPAENNRDYYMWYNCTLGMFQAGGENWKRWNSIVRDTIVNLQQHGGCPNGSWDPSDKWGGRGGRIYSTALAILTLEVYYRYTAPDELKPEEFELHSTGKEQGEK